MLSSVIGFAMVVGPWGLACGGDIMLNGIKPDNAPLGAVADIFQTAVYSFANLEIPLTDAKSKTDRKEAKELKARTQFILQASPKHIDSIKECDFSFLSIANNHAMDYGSSGLAQMIKVLDAVGIQHSGAGANWKAALEPAAPKQYLGAPKIKLVAFLAFNSPQALRKCGPATTDKPGIAVLSFQGAIDEKAKAVIANIVKRSRGKDDFLVVSLHFGIERETVPSSYQVSLSRAFIDAGADMVLGTHPHVLQGAEMYKRRPIFYSLGNLVSPSPGSTAIFRMDYLGRTLEQVTYIPCNISGGRVGPKDVREWRASLNDYKQLCELVRKRYPDPDSVVPTFALQKS